MQKLYDYYKFLQREYCMIYFDNAATSGLKPDSVINAVAHTLKNLSVNAGRSSHKLSIEALKLITQTREISAEFFGVEACENVIFTKNCTEALNIAILGTVKEGGEIIISSNEHNSVIRPCFELEKAGKIKLKVVNPDENGCVTAEIIENSLSDKTYMVCVNHVSNVTGGTADIEGIAQLCRKNKILFLCDCAQSGGHIDINMQKSKIDIIACAGHKGLLAPQGTGLLCFNRVKINPVIFGGTGTESHNVYQPQDYPESLECGTLNLPGISGLNASLKFIIENKNRLYASLENNFKLLYNALKRNALIKIFSFPNKCGIISFLISGYDSVYIGDYLNNKYNIAVRAGLHCAPLVHKNSNTLKSGLVRVSLSPFNTTAEIQTFIEAIESITYN